VVPAGATVVVAGDLSGLDVVSEIEQALGSWSGAAVGVVEPREAARALDRRTYRVSRPSGLRPDRALRRLPRTGPQCRRRLGVIPRCWLCRRRLPNARVDAILREEKGFTYGIRSGFRPAGVGECS